MIDSANTLISMLKAQAWEDAKGKLRALAAMQGSYHHGSSNPELTKRWEAAEEVVEAFIRDFEAEGLHE